MKIAIVGPIHKTSVVDFLHGCKLDSLPEGYFGAPFFGNLFQAYLSKGHEVVGITMSKCENGNWTAQTFNYGMFTWIVIPFRPHAVRFSYGKWGRMLDAYRYEIRELTSVLRQVRPDIVHAHWSYEFTAAAIASGFPRVITVHDHHWKVLWYIPKLYRLVRAFMAEYNLRQLNNVTTVSPYMEAFCKRKVQEVKVIPNPVSIRYNEAEVIALIDQRLLRNAAPEIVIVNNGWKGHKNGEFGLRVFQELRGSFPGAILHLAGSGSEPGGAAETDAKRLGIQDHVRFHGIINQPTLFRLLENAHLLLHTSREESFGVVLIEAGSTGMPAVGNHKAGAVPWVINNEALLYAKWNATEVAARIAGLLLNPELYRQVALEAYLQATNRFSVEKVAAQYLQEYLSAIQCSD